MLYAADNGHAFFKGLGNGQRVLFPSILGEVPRNLSIAETNGYIQLGTSEGEWLIGSAAINQSANLIFGRDSDWVFTPFYRALLLAGISEVVSPTTSDVTIDLVSGLPYIDFPNRHKLIDTLVGEHQVRRPARRNLTVSIRRCMYVPQSLAILSLLKNVGKDEKRVILDFGGRNIGYSTFIGNQAIANECGSKEKGTLDMIESIADVVKARFGLELNHHQTIQAIERGSIRSDGVTHDITSIVDEKTDLFLDGLRSLKASIWKNAKEVDRFVVVGGGVINLEKKLGRYIDSNRLEVLPEPQWANVVAYINFGKVKFGVS